MGTFADVSGSILYLIWILRGYMIMDEDKSPLQMQKGSFFHLDRLEFCFFFSLLLQLEKCSIMWNRLCSVKSSERILKPHCGFAWHVTSFGVWEGIVVHGLTNQILQGEYQIWSFRKKILEPLPKLLYEIHTCLKWSSCLHRHTVAWSIPHTHQVSIIWKRTVAKAPMGKWHLVEPRVGSLSWPEDIREDVAEEESFEFVWKDKQDFD